MRRFYKRDLKEFLLILITFAIINFSNLYAAEHDYGYPIKNPLAATIIGTPPEFHAEVDLQTKFKLFNLKVFEDRVTPRYFWYNDKITYSLLAQKEKAPLIFIIAGTGGDYDGRIINMMASAFYQEGYHVVSLPSPTHMSFIIAASNSTVPGLLDDDSHDLYNVMKLAWQKQLKRRIEVSDFYVTGYSLGGAQAAYVAYIDEHQKFFNFKKALLLNTPVSLFNSVEILDNYIERNFPTSESFRTFWEEVWGAITKRFQDSPSGELELTPQFLFDAYKERKPKEENLEGLIGTAFRISAASLITTSDVMSESGYIVPVGTTASIRADVTDYAIVAHRTGFMDYAHDLMLPFFQQRDPNITFEKLVERASLFPIEEYLRKNKKIGLMHNADDIIMAPGEIDWLADVFGERSKIYPHGGHLGNVGYKDNVEYMINFFKE